MHKRPTIFNGARHRYFFFAEPWTDSNTGTYFEQGYYDEMGHRYDSVAFEENGQYKNVVCHCQYCGQDMVLDLSSEDAAGKGIVCTSCGAPMEICSMLDKIQEETTDSKDTHTYSAEESLENTFPKKKKRGHIWLIILAAVLALGIEGGVKKAIREKLSPAPAISQSQQISVVENTENTREDDTPVSFGEYVAIEKQENGSYHVVTDVLRADKILYFDTEADSYYDETSNCWLWYNTDVIPAVWQYWYDGISSDYGDYGWMEHASDGWWIEESEGNWVPVPSRYDTSDLWFIE